ncbi:biotin/lipoyl-binding protein [Paenibacillus sp. NPDC056579]|uniref:biotin/lipoyl-binding protein n=1 Tax=Paenibacillus sp. NPDC056579 TaxID=3345871 RepID=UPI0036A156E5
MALTRESLTESIFHIFNDFIDNRNHNERCAPIEQEAEVKAGTTLDIISKANGEVTQVLKSRGDYVNKGDVLFVIDSKAAEIAMKKSEVSLKNAGEALQKVRLDNENNHKNLLDDVTRAETALQNATQNYSMRLINQNKLSIMPA